MRLLPFALLLLLLSGCSLPSISTEAAAPRYYVLPSPSASGAEATANKRLAIMPVILPGYLSRTQIVTTDGGTAITVHDYDRWGEELGAGVVRVVGNALSAQGIACVPLRQGTLAERKLQIEIRRFDGTPGGQVVLDTVWTMQKDSEIIKTGHVLKSRNAGSDMQAMVASLSGLLQDLAKTIAVSLR